MLDELLLLDRDELDELLDRDELLDDELDREDDDELEERDDELELLDDEELDDELEDALDEELELDADEELADELLESAELDETPMGVGSAGLPPQAAIRPEAARAAPPDSSSRNSRLAVRISWFSSAAGRVRSWLMLSPLPGGGLLAKPARLLRNTTRSVV